MAVELEVTEELQTYLIAQGVGVLPAGADGTKVTIWLAPRDGAPQPVKGSNLEPATVTLRATLIGRPNDLDYAIEETFVDVIVRARQNSAAKMIQRQIRGLLVPGDAVGGRKMFAMGAIDPVERCVLWRGDQEYGADETSYDRVQSFMFQVRRKILAGLPYGTP